jgi:hypothetical protein
VKKKSFNFPVNVSIAFLIVFAMLISSPFLSGADAGKPEILKAVRAQAKPNIDGVLDENVWKTAPIKKTFITTTPSYGYELPMDTLVWIAYDKKNLYFAFRCLDPEPDKIKTSITSRDNIFDDDWISVSVDAMGNGQTGYVLFVNPNGIQGDALTSSMHLDDDNSPDIVWSSAAKLTDKGYDVEISLPLKSIRFKSGKKVEMGILFRRRVSRLSYIGAWPEIPLNQWILTSQTKAVFDDLKKQTKIEVLPSLTHSSNSERVTPDDWSDSVNDTEFGIGVKYGLTSSTTAEITINPDFSQVESDALQVEVNQRYPLFYSEKRPFFMEGTGIFNFWTYVYGFFPKAVHTRQIVNPRWATKLTGSSGKFSFGVLSAGDRVPLDAATAAMTGDDEENGFFGVARGKFGFGKDSYVGFLYTGHDEGNRYNHLFGVDSSFRLANKHWLRGSYIYSASRDADGETYNGSDTSYGNFTYTYGTRKWILVGAVEHMGKDFQADVGYMQRTGVNVVRTAIYYNIYPNQKKIPWLRTVTPFVGFDYIHDLNTGKDDSLLSTALNFYLIKDTTLSLQYLHKRENWQGIDFDKDMISLQASFRPSKWLQFSGSFGWKRDIYYYAYPAFMGTGYTGGLAAVIQPSDKFNLNLNFTHTGLKKDGLELYNVNILYSKATYQFNKYFFLRSVVQYNSFDKQLLTDFLASFTLIPGSVLHVGYGGIYEKRSWTNGAWIPLEGQLYNIKRSFFAKVSYLWRF